MIRFGVDLLRLPSCSMISFFVHYGSSCIFITFIGGNSDTSTHTHAHTRTETSNRVESIYSRSTLKRLLSPLWKMLFHALPLSVFTKHTRTNTRGSANCAVDDAALFPFARAAIQLQFGTWPYSHSSCWPLSTRQYSRKYAQMLREHIKFA